MAVVRIGENIRAYLKYEEYDQFKAFAISMVIVGTGAMYENTSEYIIEDYGNMFDDIFTIEVKWSGIMGKLKTGYMTKEQAEYYNIELDNMFVWNIDGNEYYWCKNNVLLIPDEITSVSNDFLKSSDLYKDLKTLIIGKDVEIIGDSAFEDIYNDTLEQVIFDGATKLKSLGARCFYSNGGLKTIDICGAKPTLGESCFSYCTGLQYINFGAYLENIPAMCFKSCKSLIEFNKGNTIKSFEISSNSSGNGIFIDCNSITYFTFHEDCVFQDNSAGYNSYFKVSLNAGNNCDENGLQITEIRGASTHAQCRAWNKLDNRKVVCSKPYLVLNHLEKKVIIKCYPKPFNNIDKYYPIKHKDRVWYLKTSKMDNNTNSPLVIHDRSKKVYISY